MLKITFHQMRSHLTTAIIGLALVMIISGCGGGGSGGGGSTPPKKNENVTITGKVDVGATADPIENAQCRFLDQDGVQRATATSNAEGEFALVVPVDVEGYVSCTPSTLSRLALSTYCSTQGQADGSTIANENVTPFTTVVAQIITAENAADPERRKEELLETIASAQDPYLNLMVELSTRLYIAMLNHGLNVNFADGQGEGGDSGGDSGGAGGETGDGGDFSPIPDAYCEFVIDNDLSDSRSVLFNAALADFYADGQMDRPDLADIQQEIAEAFEGREQDIIAAFENVFPDGLGQPYSDITDENGAYFIPIPPNVPGFVRCTPQDQDRLVLATYVPPRSLGETLDDQDVNPATTVFSTYIASKISDGDMAVTKENYLKDIDGLDVQILFDSGTVTGFQLRPGTTPANREVGLVAFSATSLFNILYKNKADVDYLAALNDFTEKQRLDPDFLVDQGLPAAQADQYSGIVDDAVEETGTTLDTNLNSALTTARINVTVTDTTGGTPRPGVLVNIAEDVTCEGCGTLTDENGQVTLVLSGISEDPETLTITAAEQGGDTSSETVQVVALATVDIAIALQPSYSLTLAGTGDGEGTVTSDTGALDCAMNGTVENGTCTSTFVNDTPVTLTAVAGAGSAFTEWSGEACSGTNPSCTVTMDQAQTVTAVFSLQCIADNYALSPTENRFEAEGGTGRIEVAAPQECPWTAVVSDDWVTLTADADGSGSAIVTYTVSENTATIARTATITIAGIAHTIRQTSASDSAAPTVAITSPTAAVTFTTSSGTINIGGTADDNVGVTQVTWSSNSAEGTCTLSGTNWNATNVPLAAGSNTITVTASDAAGNTATDVLTVTYNAPDTVDPTITITSPTDAATYATSSATINIGGTATDNVAVTSVTWINSANEENGTCVQDDTAFSAVAIPLVAGGNTITITATDAAGNTATDELTVTYTPRDETAPTIRITTPTTETSYETDSASLDIGGTATDNVGVVRVVWANTSNDSSGTCTLSGTTFSASGIPLAAGSNTISVTATDAAGNVAIDRLDVTYTVPDTTDPTVAITSPTASDTYPSTSATINIGGTATDNVAVTQVTWANSATEASGTCTLSGTNWNATGVPLAAGSNTLQVTARDAAGNTATDTLTVTYTIPDATDPTITITSPTSSDTYSTSSATINISGTATDNVAVTQVTWSNSATEDGGTCTFSGTTFSATGIALAEGGNTLRVTARDAAGNTATDTLTVTYTAPDTTDPTITITSPTSSDTYSTSSATINISGTATDNVAVTQVTWSNSATEDGGTCTLSGTTFSATGITLATGVNTITVTARDAARNTAVDRLAVTYEEADSAPEISNITQSLLSLNAGNCTDPYGVTYTGTIFNIGFSYTDEDGDAHEDDGATVNMGFDITPWSTFTGNGYAGAVVSRLCTDFTNNNTVEVTARLTDGSGNRSNTLTTTLSKPEGYDTCFTQTVEADGDDVYSHTKTIELGRTSGVFQLDFDTYDDGSDRIIIEHEGEVIFDSTCVEAVATEYIDYSGESSRITVEVQTCSDSNTATWSYTVSCPSAYSTQADLVVENFSYNGLVSSVPIGTEIGDLFDLSLRNTGGTAAGSFFVGFYTSPDAEISTADRLLIGGREYVESLAAGASVTVPLADVALIPTDINPGRMYLGVVIDEYNTVEEANEANNTASIAVTLTSADTAPAN